MDNTGQAVEGTYPTTGSHTGTADADIDAPEAWAITESGSANDVIVAVIDTGVAYNHPDLANNMWDGANCKDENGNFLGGCNHGYDYVDNDKTPLTGYKNLWNGASSHGTHVAGIIASIKNNGKGIIGVAPRAKIMALRFGFDTASEIKAIDFATQNGAKVINASYGGSQFSQAEYDAIARFRDVGGIFVAAAGNSSKNLDALENRYWLNYPAMYDLDNIVSVAATDQNDALATFSNYGKVSVDVGAPGTNIYSTLANSDIIEDFETVVTPALPSDWVKGGTNNKWATDYNDESWGNVLWSQYPGMPYDASANTSVTSPAYDLGGSTSGANISFYAGCDTEYSGFASGGYNEGLLTDYMALEYSADGINFSPVPSPYYYDTHTGPLALKWNEEFLGGMSGGSSENVGQVYYFRDLAIPTEFLTSNFKLRFRWRTNATGNNYYGCYVDDVTVSKFTDGTEESYGYMSGTSMAAPYVAGLVALVGGYNSLLNYSQIKNVIFSAGDRIASLWNITSAATRINAQKTIQAVAYYPPQKKITSFIITNPSAIGIINETNHTIAITVPFGTDITSLIPTISINGDSISPASGVAKNFTNPITYIVTGSNALTQEYVVTVTIAPDHIHNGANAIDVIGKYVDTTATPLVPEYGGPVSKIGLYGLTNMALDSVRHRLFMTDTNNDRVLVFNLNNDNTLIDYIPDNVLGQIDFSINNIASAVTQSSLLQPQGLAYDSVANRLFVGDIGNYRVMVFDVASISNGENAVNVLGALDFISNSGMGGQRGVGMPGDMVFVSTTKQLFVAVPNDNRVMIFDVTTSTMTNGKLATYVLGQSNFTTYTSGLSAGKFYKPQGLAYDPVSSRLFVADGKMSDDGVNSVSNNRVLVFNVATITNGKTASYVLGQNDLTSNSYSGPTQNKIKAPKNLTYDSATKRLFVATADSRIMVYTVETSTIANGQNAINILGQADFVTVETGTAQNKLFSSEYLSDNSYGMEFDPLTKRLLVADFGNNRVMIFDASTSTITNGANAIDAIGQYQDETVTPLTINYTKGGPNNSPSKVGFYGPVGIIIDATYHRLFVADSSNNRVLVYNLNANNTLIDYIPDNVLGQIDFLSKVATTTANGLSGPADLVFDPVRNRLFVNDGSNSRVMVFDTTSISNNEAAVNVLGQLDFTSRLSVSPSFSANYFQYTSGLAYDSVHERLFVSESSGNRVLIFDVASITNGEDAVDVLGQTDFNSNTEVIMSGPNGLAYDSYNQRLFVNANVNGSGALLIFDVTHPTLLNGGIVTNSLSLENQGGVVGGPLFYDDVSHRIFIVGTNRVLILDSSNIADNSEAINVLGQPDFDSTSSGSGQSNLAGSEGLFYDPTNKQLYVADKDNSRIMVFNATPEDQTAPTSTSFSPANNATGTATTVNLTLNFSEPIYPGDGGINIYKSSDDSLFESIPAPSTKVTGYGSSTIIINPASNLAEKVSYYVNIDSNALADTSGNSYLGISDNSTWTFTIGDFTNPNITTSSPVGTLNYGTASTTVSVTTDQNANCKYSTTAGTSYASMLDFESTGAIVHFFTATGLVDGGSYDYYVKCQDYGNLESTEAHIAFAVGTRTIVIPTISNPLPTGVQSAGTAQVTLSVSTDQNATCKYSSNSGTSFGSMTIFTTTGEWSHSTVVSGLTNGTAYNYYIKCQNLFGDETAETTISFSIASPPSTGGGAVIIPPPSTGAGGSDVVAAGVGVTVAVGAIPAAGVNVLTYVTNLNNFTTPESSHGWGAGSHSFQITNLDLAKKIAIITFHSDPITVTLTQGEIQAIDLDGDGKNDINVTFANLNSNRAEITLKSLVLASSDPVFGAKPPIIVTPQGRIIKVNAKNRPAVYYVSDGKKYLFVNRDTYTTWSNAIGDTGNRFATLQAITQTEFDAIPTGGNLIAKAGNLIKFDDSAIVYAVGSDGKLYKLIDLTAQTALYGKAVPYVIQSGFRDDYYNHGNSFSTLTASSIKPE